MTTAKQKAEAKNKVEPQGEAPGNELRMGASAWVFVGERGTVPMAVWSSLDAAHRYIHDERLSGSLTVYTVDVPIYEAAIHSGKFKPSKDQHRSLKFRQTFSNQYQEHYHFVDGYCKTLGTPNQFEERE